MKQKKIFLESEGNQWFRRNQKLVISPEVDLIKRYTSSFQKGRILEIGCSTGYKLNAYKLSMNGYGIDPSRETIEEGRTKYKELDLSVQTADSLKFEEGFFNIVVFGFCFFLIDRSLLLRVVAEADRVLKDKGFLIITDFDTLFSFKRNYKHFPGVYSYKYRYANLFLANPAYMLVEKISYSHEGNKFHLDPQERLSAEVLYKDIESRYIEA